MDGIEVIQKIRTWSVVPIIVISARSDDQDKVDALDVGADDYLTKPFSVEELLARLRSTLRRLQYLLHTESVNASVFYNGELMIDYGAGTVSVEGREIHLMPLEYSLLCLLAQNVGKVLTYQFILDKVWVNALEGDMSSLRVYMASLRKKIEKDTAHPQYIQTHIGIGYRMIKVEDKATSGQG
jgi:two-component system KDP operon response regulator KdpE